MSTAGEELLETFGQDFANLPKHLAEDTIEYSLFVIRPDKESDSRVVREQLEGVLSAANALIQDVLQDYIWQRELFELKYDQLDGQFISLRFFLFQYLLVY